VIFQYVNYGQEDWRLLFRRKLRPPIMCIISWEGLNGV